MYIEKSFDTIYFPFLIPYSHPQDHSSLHNIYPGNNTYLDVQIVRGQNEFKQGSLVSLNI